MQHLGQHVVDDEVYTFMKVQATLLQGRLPDFMSEV